MFFVLSGFLITSLLLAELRRRPGLDLRPFYAAPGPAAAARARRGAAGQRRARGAVVGPTPPSGLRGRHASPRCSTSTNWWYVVHDHVVLRRAPGRPPLLQHLWSLAIEEQFYLVWPVIAFALYRWGGRLRVASVALVAALVSTGWMADLSVSGDAPGANDASRLYFGTDSHAMGLLLGAAFAAVWRMDQLPPRVGATATRTLTAVGVAGLVGIGYFVHEVGPDTVWLYRGGFLVLSAAVVLVIAAAVHPALGFGRVLGWGPTRYLGTRSYGLYLYHWPIFLVLRPGVDLPWTGGSVLVLRLAATLAVAELSYRLVEMPIRNGALRRLWTTWRERYGRRFWPSREPRRSRWAC